MHRSILRPGVLGALFLMAVLPAAAFDLERPEAPEDGAVLGDRVRFYISAEGDWEQEQYKIELSNDGFDTIFRTFDGTQNRKGWAVAALPEGAEEEDLEDFAPHRGIYYRLSEPLPDGDYVWRAFKYDATGFKRLGSEMRFRVDTVAPAEVEGVRVDLREDGRLELRWDPVFEDQQGNPDEVAGYRVYRFLQKRASQNRPAYLVGEAETTRFLLPARYDDAEAPVLFFRVTAVDRAGNEVNRAIPHPLGDLAPPDPRLVR